MTVLNQLVAVEQGVKSKAHADLTQLHHVVQKPALLNGLVRTYAPKDDDGDQLPPESTLVQVKVDEVLKAVQESMTRLFDVTLTKEHANAQAKADVKVDGKTIVKDAPVTYLLFLEKQLVGLRTFVEKLPTLDPASNWSFDNNDGVWKTEPVKTVKTKKVPKNWVKAEATDKHPAQVEIFHEDVLVGTWTKVDFSGAIPTSRKNELLARVDALATAVKFAREEANSLTVADRKTADSVFSYLFS